jgi:galactokinase/galacturonokinase
MALIDPAFEESITRKVSEAYLKDFPHLKGKYSVHICHSADGAEL